MIIIIETIVLCIIFTLMVYIMSKDPIKTLYNYPPKVIEKVKSMKEYQDKIPTTENKILAKTTAAITIIIFVSLILKYINGYTTFEESFQTSLLIWTIINIYDVIILDILWFCHSKRFIFKGTESISKEYKNYWFHIKEGIIGELIGATICVIIGLVVKFIL